MKKTLPTFAALIAAVICTSFNKLAIYKLLWLIPLAYGIAYFLFNSTKTVKNYKFGVILHVFNIAAFFKYVLTPVAMVYQEYYSVWGGPEGMWGPTPRTSVMNWAIAIESVESMAVYMTVYAVIRFVLNRHREEQISIQKLPILFKNRSLIYAFCVVALVYIIAVSPSSLTFSSLLNFTDDNGTSSNMTNALSHFGVVIIFKQVLLFSIVLLLWEYIYKKLKINTNFKILLSAAVLLAYLSLIRANSRWDLLFTIIAGFSVLNIYYGKKINLFVLIFGIIFAISFFGITTVKFAYSLGTNASISKVISILVGQMPDYFSGPRLVAQGMEVKKIFGSQIGLATIINDLFGNFPLLSELANQQNRMAVYFNYYNFGNWKQTGLLMPLVGNSYCFIPFFPWILSIFFTVLTVIFDYMSRTTKYLEFKFLYLMEGCWLAFSLCLDFQTSWGHFISVFLMTWIVFMLNRKIKITLGAEI